MSSPELPEISGELSSLIWPQEKEQFFADTWGRRCHWAAGGSERIRPFVDLLGSLDPSQLIAQSRQSEVVFPTPRAVNSTDGLRAFERGSTLRLDVTGPINTWARQVSMELGIPNVEACVQIEAARSEIPYPLWHQEHLFFVQLDGVTEWEVADHELVVGALREGYEAEQRFFSSEEPVSPREFRAMRMDPGCVLYVPRGAWHRMQTTSSLLLRLAIQPQPWFEVILQQLRRALLSQASWRETARINSGTEIGQKWDELCDLVTHITTTKAHTPRNWTRGAKITDDTKLRRSLGSSWRVEARKENAIQISVGRDWPGRISVSPDVFPLYPWLAQQSQPFTFRDVQAAFSDWDRELTLRLVSQVLRTGFLEISSDA